MPLKNLPLRHKNYYELQAMKKEETQEKVSALPLSTRKGKAITGDNSPISTQRWHQRNLHNTSHYPYLPLVSPIYLPSYDFTPWKLKILFFCLFHFSKKLFFFFWLRCYIGPSSNQLSGLLIPMCM